MTCQALEEWVPVSDRVRDVEQQAITALGLKILQVNLGFRCNMACRHCHVSAGSGRSEIMDVKTIETVLRVLTGSPIRSS